MRVNFKRAALAFLSFGLLLSGCSGSGPSDTSSPPPAPTNNAPVVVSAASIEVFENTTDGYTIEATDSDGDSLSYSIAGGPDEDLFVIEGAPDFIGFIDPPNYEIPLDADSDNAYELLIAVSDGTDITEFAVTISVLDVDELPEGVSRFEIETNANDPVFYYATMESGAVFTAQGVKDSDGFPQALTSLSAVIPDEEAPDGEWTVDYQLNADATALSAMLIQGLGRITFGYDEFGTPVTIGFALEDGTGEAILSIEEFFSGTSTASSSPNPLYAQHGRESLIASIQRMTEVAQAGGVNRQPRRSRQALTSVSSAVTRHDAGTPAFYNELLTLHNEQQKTVNVRIEECGLPVNDAIVVVEVDDANATGSDRSRRLRANRIGAGEYRVNFPITRTESSVEDTCNAIFEIPNNICTWTEVGTNAPAYATGCLQLGAILATGGATAPAAGPATAACEGAVLAGFLYCNTFGLSPAPGAPTASEGLCAAAEIVRGFVADFDDVTVSAEAIIPDSGRYQSATDRSTGGSTVDLSISGRDTVQIDRFYTSPIDPDPDEDYTASAELSCATEPTITVMSITGTDGYSDSNSCTITGQGTCNLNVPGAEANVVDTIRVSAEDQSRTITIRF